MTQTLDGSSGATFSACGKYRYDLWRRWDDTLPNCCWIMLNPSTADGKTNDPTIRKCMKFAKRWDYGGIVVVNLFAYRATNPDVLKTLDPATAIGPMNDEYIKAHVHRVMNNEGSVMAAWGQKGKLYGRDKTVIAKFKEWRFLAWAVKLAKDGSPYHPLYVRDDAQGIELNWGRDE